MAFAFSGFEGFEKRLELHFFCDDPALLQLGLRKLDFDCIHQTLQEVQCTVVSAVGNSYFDAYVLSESSLFVYPTKIIIKTCGTTQLLKSMTPLIFYAHTHLGLTLSSCRYTRGTFIFPLSQPFPHTSFNDEVTYIEATLPPNLCFRKASIMPSKSSSHAWHVFTATSDSHALYHHNYTLEICMTDLDPLLAGKFFRLPGDGRSGDSAGREMTELTGIDGINPHALVCDFAFDPCGYSMNGMDGEWYSTIHVTPEEGYSYASFECVGSRSSEVDVVHVLRKVVQIFRPGTMSVSTTSLGNEVWRKVAGAVEPMGMKLRSCAMDQFPDSGSVVFQTFSPLRRKSGH
ncbi:S-adenosylmethionine decarboxylase proenzyme 4-like [Vigna umbellata]|uniref:S-adenosylmethionine decarboxylase proenzyme 4-like n=1 Tax=Vigna umbellata TaxID=87088 RepID=UPI001F5FB0DF|nr:S-adenosylmethionine decarboxylase proenzyme 4-like [Vigna umbellata]